MTKLLIGTNNRSKINMYKNIFSELEIDIDNIYYLDDFDSIPEPVENGYTVKDNALLKAKYYNKKFDMNVLADDAGFAIKVLDWKPWVKARRWWWQLDDDVSDEDFLDFFMDKIKDLPGNDSWLLKASFPFVRCLYLKEWKNTYYQKDKIDVYLQKKARKPIKDGWPVQSCLVYPDGRHAYDIPKDDPIWKENFKVDWLIDLLNKRFSIKYS